MQDITKLGAIVFCAAVLVWAAGPEPYPRAWAQAPAGIEGHYELNEQCSEDLSGKCMKIPVDPRAPVSL